jgi:hypothetical protein
MKIDLDSIDRVNFMVHEHILNGEVVHLVQPVHIGASWNRTNKHFRSSVWNNEGELISAGFPKFTNWGEKPEEFPVPTDLRGAVITEKLDGSLLIVSKYKGNFILRTRGTVDAYALDNGHELELFKQKYPDVFTYQPYFETWPFSLLFEWTSPNQRIVLSYGDEADWVLVGGVFHDGGLVQPAYSLFQQDYLDSLAKGFGCRRPEYYTFTTVEDLLANVDAWKGKEGVCVYSKDGQAIHKVKGAWYLALHHMKSQLASFEKVVDVWISMEKPDYTTFYNAVATQFDFELANQIRGDVSRICDGYKEVQKIVTGMTNFVNTVKKDFESRKGQAVAILSAYGETNRAAFCFKLLDGKTLADDDLKKLLFQVLKR